MSYSAAILIVIFAGAASALGASILDRILTRESRRRHHEVGSQIFQLIGIMFSVLLAFVFSEVWSEYNTAAQAIDTECDALHSAAVLADTLPRSDARRINTAILGYTRFVRQQEWPAMRGGLIGIRSIEEMRFPLNVAALAGSGDVKAQILGLMAQAQAARETRLFQAGLGMPPAMWVMVIAIGGILILFVLVSGTQPPGTVILAASFAASIAMVLVLVRMLDYPFQGALALDDGRFRLVAHQTEILLQGEQQN
ncbi:MAG TPA: hypothetical protein VHX61_08340 [Rhizomicrobium sp.]|jgi:hypothetical protein|nr:hypothetical protein [Rhizomicrobium sp.]